MLTAHSARRDLLPPRARSARRDLLPPRARSARPGRRHSLHAADCDFLPCVLPVHLLPAPEVHPIERARKVPITAGTRLGYS